MHRYREFGLVSEQDELFRRAFRDGFKRAGLSFPRFLDALAWYRDQPKPAADEAHLAEAFSAFATDRGWTAQQRDHALDLYRAIRDNGPAAATHAPSPDEDRETLVRADELLRRDPAHYWGDGELQDAAFEARERLGNLVAAESTEPPFPRVNGDLQRVDEIEALLHDPSGEGQRRYWSDAGLRKDYAQALARVHDGMEGSSGESPAQASIASGDARLATENA